MKPTDIVYILGNGSKFGDDAELRFSLRSMANQPWLNNIYLIGHKPKWVKNIIHIPCPDHHPAKRKDINLITKILRACSIPELTEDFVVNSDDQFALKILNTEDFGPWEEYPAQYNDIKHVDIQNITSTWKQRLKQTVDYCLRNKMPTFVTELHTPYLVNKRLYPQLMHTVPWHLGNGLLTHVYFNLMNHHGYLPAPTLNKNAAIRIKEGLTHQTIDAITSNKIFLNFNNPGFSPDMKYFLNKRFPVKSKYE